MHRLDVVPDSHSHNIAQLPSALHLARYQSKSVTVYRIRGGYVIRIADTGSRGVPVPPHIV